MKYISTFSGIGGFELGIEKVLEDSQCVGYSEIDKYAIKTYESHFDHYNYGDITAIEPDRLPDFDLIVGGFPCQAFSVAGKRLGFEETRGTLFFDVARILDNKRPRHLVLENVKGLLSHDGGKTFSTILGVLTDMGYRVEWQVLNSKNFGVPQNRERVYIVGHLGEFCTRQIFPLSGEEPVVTDFEVGVVANGQYRSTNRTALTVTASYWKATDNHGQRPVVLEKLNEGQSGRVYSPDGVSPTLSTMQGGGNKHPKIVAQRGRGDIGNTSQRLEYRKDYVSNTLTAVQKDNMVDLGVRIRRLTPVECERLQGFPDNWTAGVSDTQRYKQCGNAVTVNVVAFVMDRLKYCLDVSEESQAA